MKAEQQVGCKNAAGAARKAPIRVGVDAYSVSADVEMGGSNENPTLLFKAERLPPPWDKA